MSKEEIIQSLTVEDIVNVMEEMGYEVEEGQDINDVADSMLDYFKNPMGNRSVDEDEFLNAIIEMYY